MAKETISQTEGLCKEVANCIRNAYDRGYKQGFKDGNFNKEFFCNMNFKHGINKGLDDAWELLRKLRHPSYEDTYSDDEKRDIFGYVSADSILTNLSASEAIAKIKEFEEKQKLKADDEIKVGDEVMVDERHFVVIGIENGEWRHLWCMDNGLTYSSISTHDMKKTGKHFDQIAEVLEQLKGE